MRIIRIISAELKDAFLSIIRWLPGMAGVMIRYHIYKKHFAACGKNICISMGCYIRDSENISLGSDLQLGLNSQLLAAGNGTERLEIGNGFSSNSNVMINADCGGRIVIGNNVQIGPNSVLRASNHEFKDLHKPISQQGHQPGKIVIEDDVWLGSNVVVLPNVIIKRGSVVGAGAVVTKDVEPFSIVGGVPARLIAKRA